MKQCPECNRWSAEFMRICKCGYAFEPESNDTQPSGRGSIILCICGFFAVLQCVGALLAAVIFLYNKDYWLGVVVAPVAVIYSLGLLIVFSEVDNLIAARNKTTSESQPSDGAQYKDLV